MKNNGGIKIPYIKIANKYWRQHGCFWEVCMTNSKSSDVTFSFGRAIRLWLWYWGVNPKIAFWSPFSK